MIEQLIDALRTKELNPTGEEIADLLWLAEQMGAQTYNQAAAFARQNDQRAQVDTADGDEPWDHDDKRSDQPLPNAQRDASQQPGANAQLPPDQDGEDGDEGLGGLPFRSPGSAALPDALELARALRHLKRRVSSRTQLLLDEEATVRHIVDTDDWSPVQKPAPARWLDVVLVIDESSSMVVWEQLITEFHQLLERQGAFRTVRRWYMATDTALTETSLYAERGGAEHNSPRRNATELLDPQGQRLILIISDCVSAGWVDGTVAGLLKGWSDKGTVALVQMLPQHMWLRTALRSGTQLYLRSNQPGMVNARLERHMPRRQRRRQPETNNATLQGAVLPVVTLEKEQLLPWAKLIAGANIEWTPGFVLPLAPEIAEESVLSAQLALTAEERVQRFFATSSPAAQELAGYLSTVPLSLGLMRLVQEAMFKDRRRQVHLAEVLLSGLLEQRHHLTYIKSDDIQYEFFPGVRERLQDKVLASDAIAVLESVSNFVNAQTGQAIEFRALITNPSLANQILWTGNNHQFAILSSKVLSRLGGQYRKLATMLDRLGSNRFTQYGGNAGFGIDKDKSDSESSFAGGEIETQVSSDFQDFNNQLAIILSHCAIALNKLPVDSTTRSNIKRAGRAAKRAVDLVFDLSFDLDPPTLNLSNDSIQESMEPSLHEKTLNEETNLRVSGLRHDFNNQLAIILSHCSIALNKLPVDSNTRSNLEQAIQATKRAVDLVFDSSFDLDPPTLNLSNDSIQEPMEPLHHEKPLEEEADLRMSWVRGDFNNQLAIILSHCAIALNKLPVDSTTRSNIKRAGRATKRAVDLVFDLSFDLDPPTLNLSNDSIQESMEPSLHEKTLNEETNLRVSGLRHDFNNQLAIILSHCSIALNKLPVDSNTRSNLEQAIQATKRAADLSSQVQAYLFRSHDIDYEDTDSLLRRPTKELHP